MAVRLTRRVLLAGSAAALVSRGENDALPAIPNIPERYKQLWQRALGGNARAGSPAILVSREQWQKLPPLRGWQDERFLNAYLDWADRPEGVGFHEERSEASITADIGPHDWILLRRPFGGWNTALPTHADPLGLLLIEPKAGRNEIVLTRGAGAPVSPLSILSMGVIPDIGAAVLISNAPGNVVVTLYGTGLKGKQVEIASEAGPGEILYSASTQINARVPSLDRVRVSVEGTSTPWVAVKRP